MGIISRLFLRKTNNQQPKEVVQIGTEIERPAQLAKPLSNYVDEVPGWIGEHSGWGYNKKDALIMACDNSREGIHNEYVFAEARSKIEVDDVLKMYMGGFERCGQTLVVDGTNHRYDVIRFKVYLFTEKDWNLLKDDYESHNEYKDDKEGLKKHMELRNQRIKYYTSECWIDIDAFYGKN